jgi:hypothetical protein
MTRAIAAIFCIGFLASITAPLSARPDYYQQFLDDPLRSADAEGCGVCHEDAAGGGPRNPFGIAFEEAGLVVTPLMRASFSDLYDVPIAAIGERGTLYFSDPENLNAVVEIDGESYLIGVPAGLLGPAESAAEESSTGEETAAPGGAPENFSFFVTSTGKGKGGNLGAIAGADRHCQALAESVGAGDRTWRAYLSTSFDGAPAIHAGDRIGDGPWHNIRGIRIARGVADLHSDHNMINAETALTETGERPDRHDILTGTLGDGTASDQTCRNWTSSQGESAWVGHFDRQGGGDDGASWNSSHLSRGCSQEELESTGGSGLFYCFAID